jgi:hypothetical protein
MSEQRLVEYNDNLSPDGNHSFGPPELIIAWPEIRDECRDISFYIARILQLRGSAELGDLLEPIYSH